MLVNSRVFRLILDKRIAPFARCFHHEFNQPDPKKSAEDAKNKEENRKTIEKLQPTTPISGATSQKYTVFRDEDSTEIFDVEEERQRYLVPDEPEQPTDEYLGLNLNRGVHGVFDIEDLVDVLRKESAQDIFVCSVPNELKYVDYMVICSGRSFRHMQALASFVRHMFKIKRGKGDILPKIEGEKSHDWMALDLGNIALHIFSPKTREEYDLESLWAIGNKYDRESNKPDIWSELYEQHSSLLNDFKPISKDTDKN